MKRKRTKSGSMNRSSSTNITNLDSVWADVEGADYPLKKLLHVIEGGMADAPRVVYQQHDVSLVCGFTLNTWRKTEDCGIQYTKR